MRPIYGVIALITVVLVSCRTGSSNQEFDELVSQAQQEILLANRAGFLWSTTEKLLTQGLAAKDAGDLDKANKLVNRALKEAQLAQKQAVDQAHPKMQFPEH
jgi:hypothetical protein